MNYAEFIKESNGSDLLRLEKREKNAMRRDRIRFIRMLKTGSFRSPSAAGASICLRERESQRLLSSYVKGGNNSLLSTYSEPWWGKLSSVQISPLRSFCCQIKH